LPEEHVKRILVCLAAPLVVMACGPEEAAVDLASSTAALCIPISSATYRLRNNATGHCIRATGTAILVASTCTGADRNWNLVEFSPLSICPAGHWYAAENGNGVMTSTGSTVVYDSGDAGLDAWVPDGTNAFISFGNTSLCLHETTSQTLNFATCGTDARSKWTALPPY
jgi:hypothetical protein